MTSTSTALKEISAAARPLIEGWLDIAEKIAALRDAAAAKGLDWSQVKSLLKAQIQDERDERGGGKRVARIIEKADYASSYAEMLGLANMNEKNFSYETRPGARPLFQGGAAGGEGTQPVSVAPPAATHSPAMGYSKGTHGSPTDETADAAHGRPAEGTNHSVKSTDAVQPIETLPREQGTHAPAGQEAGDGPCSAPASHQSAAEMPDMPEFLRRRKRPLTAADFLGAG